MKRILAAAAVLEALVIAYLLLARVPGPEPAPSARESLRAAASVDPGTRGPDVPPPAEAPARDSPSTSTLLYGRLTDTAGHPVEGTGWVALSPAGGKRFSVRVGEQGGFVRAGLSPGSYAVRVSLTGYRPLEETLDIEAGVETLRRDLVLERAVVIAVRFVTPDRQPLPDAVRSRLVAREMTTFWALEGLTAIATADLPGPRLPPTMSRAWDRYGAGEYRRAGPLGIESAKDDRHGTLDVKGRLPVYVSACLRSEILATVRIDAPVERLELAVDPDRVLGLLSGVTFRVVDESGKTPATVFADLSDAQSSGLGSVKLDAKGRVTLDGRAPGELQLTVGSPDTESQYRVVALPPGEILDLGTIHLGRIVCLRGRVIGPDGSPLTGASVSWTDRDRPWAEQRGRMLFARTGDEGEFELQLGPRRYRLAVRSPDGVLWFADTDLSHEPPEVLTIRVGPGASLRIEFDRDAAFPVQYRLLDARGEVVAGGTRHGAWPISFRLAPGAYDLVTHASIGGETRRRVELTSEKASTVRVR